jgi:hypothetical protein
MHQPNFFSSTNLSLSGCLWQQQDYASPCHPEQMKVIGIAEYTVEGSV